MHRLGRGIFGGLVIWLAYSLLSQPVAIGQNGTLAPVIRHQFFTTAGAPCAGCLLNAYAAGTTTRLDTYSEVTNTTANANPVVLDAAGRATIFLSNNSYRFILTDADAVQIWDADNVSAIPASSANLDVTATAGEALTANAAVYLSDGSGALTAGRWYLADADNTYESSTASQVGIATAAIASAASGTIRLSGRVTGLSALTAGEDYYVSATDGALTTTPPTNGRLVGRADSTTTLIIGGGTAGALSLPDSDGTHRFVLLTTSNLTADRVVAFALPDVNATFDQSVQTTANPTFGTVNTGQGANELYDMDQNVLTTSAPSFNIFRPPQGRCTLTSGLAVTSADVTAATTLYYTPYNGNQITLYDGSARWVQTTFSELSIAVPATTATIYDVFVDYTAGTPALEAVAWTNDTTRATALGTQNSVYAQTGDTDSLYVCSFRTTGVSGQTEDSLAVRFVWNNYNRVRRAMRRIDSTDSWAYTTATIRQCNASTANQLDILTGLAEEAMAVNLMSLVSHSAGGINLNALIGEDSTTAGVSGARMGQHVILAGIGSEMRHASFTRTAALGRHYYTCLEVSDASGTTTWYGDAGSPTTTGAGLEGWVIQ